MTPGTYQYTSSTSGATGTLTVTGSTVNVQGLAAGGTIYRFSLPGPSPPWSSAVVELFFTDWVGNQSVADGISVPGNVTIGTNYCGPAVPNSSGQSATVTGQGSATVADNNLTLVASALPVNKFGYFLVSGTQGFIANPGGSQGNLCLGGKIAPIFFNTLEDSGALPIECDVSKMEMGDVIVLKPFAGRIPTLITGGSQQPEDRLRS